MSDPLHKLHMETAAARALRANLADILGDEQTAADVVEGQTELNEAIDVAVVAMVDDVTAKEGLEAMIKKLISRQDRIEARIANIRTALAAAMEQAGRKSIEHPAATLSLRPAPEAVRIVDEAVIPADFWCTGEPTLNKRALLAALKDKQPVPGACLNNPGNVLAIKWS